MTALRRSWRLAVVVALVVLGSLLAAAPASAAPTLRQGSRGAAVTQLQSRLATLKYDVGAADGVFGSSTLHAVVAFQKVNGLARDGIVGPRTWAALARPRVLDRHRVRSGTYLEVNLTRQVVARLKGGAVVRIYDASTGKASTPTPTGQYRVQRTIDGWRTSSLGRLWRPAYFRGGYAVHGATSVPPYPASHGCVRLTIASMNRLWPALRVGVPVEVYR